MNECIRNRSLYKEMLISGNTTFEGLLPFVA
jgi:hypothetical protein